ncbi:MAG: superoxide dismutase [Brevundimonas sp.]
MIRKTALLTGVAGALMFAAPAFAQDATQDPATDPLTQPPAAEAGVEAQAEQSGSVAPGAQVTSSDGASLGILEGAGVDASGQQTLQIRADDGQLREAPIDGATLDNGAVVLTWTEAEFDAAPAVADASSNVSGTEAPLTGGEATEEPKPETEALPEPTPETMQPVEDPQS